jgi:hypothetical protein
VTRTVREAPHRCSPGYPAGNGEIVQCDCGRYWIARCYPNPDYDRWRRLTWIGRKLRRLP